MRVRRLRKGFVARQNGFTIDLGKGYTGAMVVHFHQGRLITNQFHEEFPLDYFIKRGRVIVLPT